MLAFAVAALVACATEALLVSLNGSVPNPTSVPAFRGRSVFVADIGGVGEVELDGGECVVQAELGTFAQLATTAVVFTDIVGTDGDVSWAVAESSSFSVAMLLQLDSSTQDRSVLFALVDNVKLPDGSQAVVGKLREHALNSTLVSSTHLAVLIDRSSSSVIVVSSSFQTTYVAFVLPELFDGKWHLLAVSGEPSVAGRFVTVMAYLDGKDAYETGAFRCVRRVASSPLPHKANVPSSLNASTSPTGALQIGPFAGSYFGVVLYSAPQSPEVIARLGNKKMREVAAGMSVETLQWFGVSLILIAALFAAWAIAHALRTVAGATFVERFVASVTAVSAPLLKNPVTRKPASSSDEDDDQEEMSHVGDVLDAFAEKGGEQIAKIGEVSHSAAEDMQAVTTVVSASTVVDLSSISLQVPQGLAMLFPFMSFPPMFTEAFSRLFSVLTIQFDFPEIAVPSYAPLLVVLIVSVGCCLLLTYHMIADRAEYEQSIDRARLERLCYRRLVEAALQERCESGSLVLEDDILIKVASAISSWFPVSPSSSYIDQLLESLNRQDEKQDKKEFDKLSIALKSACKKHLDPTPSTAMESVIRLFAIEERLHVPRQSEITIAAQLLSFCDILASDSRTPSQRSGSLLAQKFVIGIFQSACLVSPTQALAFEQLVCSVASGSNSPPTPPSVEQVLRSQTPAPSGSREANWHGTIPTKTELRRRKSLNVQQADAQEHPYHLCSALVFIRNTMKQVHLNPIHTGVQPERLFTARMRPASGVRSSSEVIRGDEEFSGRMLHVLSLRFRATEPPSRSGATTLLNTSSPFDGISITCTVPLCSCPEHREVLVPASDAHHELRTLDGRPLFRCCNQGHVEVKHWLHKHATECDDSELLVCSVDSCAFALCGSCARRELGPLDRVRVQAAGIRYDLAHMKQPLTPIIALIGMQALLFPMTKLSLLVLTCSPRLACWVDDCSWSSAFASTFAVAVVLLLIRIGVAVVFAVMMEWRREQYASFASEFPPGEMLHPILRDHCRAEAWRRFLDKADMSLFSAVYRGVHFDYMSLDPLMRLVIDAGVVCSVVFTAPDSVAQKLCVAGTYTFLGFVLNVANPRLDVSLNVLSKSVVVHQLLVIGLSCLYLMLAVELDEAGTLLVLVIMLVATSCFVVAVIYVMVSEIVAPFLAHLRHREAKTLVRREEALARRTLDARQLRVILNEKRGLFGEDSIHVAVSHALLAQAHSGGADAMHLKGNTDHHGFVVNWFHKRSLEPAAFTRPQDDESVGLSFNDHLLPPYAINALVAVFRSLPSAQRRRLLRSIASTFKPLREVRSKRPVKYSAGNLLMMLAACNRAKFLDLHALPLTEVRLAGVRLMDCNLRNVNLRDADLRQTVFVRCDLRGATIDDALHGVKKDSFVEGHLPRRDADTLGDGGRHPSSMAFNPNGSLICCGDTEGSLRFYDTSLVRAILVVKRHHDGEVLSMAFAPDGSSLVSCGRDAYIRTADVVVSLPSIKSMCHNSDILAEFVKRIRRFSAEDVSMVRFSHDGGSFAFAQVSEGSGVVTVLSTAQSNLVPVLRWEYTESFRSVQMAPDNAYLWCATPSGLLSVSIQKSEARRISEFGISTRATPSVSRSAHPQRQSAVVAVSPDGVRLAYCHPQSATWYLLDGCSSRQTSVPMDGHADVVVAVEFSPDGSRVATLGRDDTVRLWDVATRKELRRIATHKSGTLLCFAPDGMRVATLHDTSFCLWQAAVSHELSNLTGHSGAVHSVATGGGLIATGGNDLCVRVWDATRLGTIAVLDGHSKAVNSVAVSRDGVWAASGSDDRTVRLWRLGSRQLEYRVTLPHAVRCVALSPNGDAVACTCGVDVLLWRVAHRRQRHTFTLSDRATCVAFDCHGGRIAASASTLVTVWPTRGSTVESRRATCTLCHAASVEALTFSPIEDLIASVCADGCAYVWSLADGSAPRHKFAVGVAMPLRCVALDDEHRLVAAGDQGTIHLWKLGAHDLNELRVFTGSQGPVLAVAFAPPSYIVSGGADWTIRVWATRADDDGHTNSAARSRCAIGDGHTEPVLCLARESLNVLEGGTVPEHRDAVLVATGGADHRVLLWNGSPKAICRSSWGSVEPQLCTCIMTIDSHPAEVRCLCFSAGETPTVISGDAAGTVCIHGIATKLGEGEGEGARAHFAPDGVTPTTVRVWLLFTFAAAASPAVALVAPCGHLIVASENATLTVWPIFSGEHRKPVHRVVLAACPLQMLMSEDHSAVVVCTTNGHLHGIYPHRATSRSDHDAEFRFHELPNASIRNGASDGDRGCSAAAAVVVEALIQVFLCDGSSYLVDWALNSRVPQPRLPFSNIRLVSVSKSHIAVVLESDPAAIYVWHSTAEGGRRQEVPSILYGHEGDIHQLTFLSSDTLVSASGDESIRAWTLDTVRTEELADGSPPLSEQNLGDDVFVFEGHMRRVVGVVISPDGRAVASVSDDNTVRMWDVKSNSERWMFDSESSDDGSSLVAIAFISPSAVIAARRNGTLLFLDTQTGALLDEMSVALSQGSAALSESSPHSAVAAVCLCVGDCETWYCGAASCLYRFHGRERQTPALPVVGGRIVAVAVHPIARDVLVSLDDSSVRVWDANLTFQRYHLAGFTVGGAPCRVAFSPTVASMSTFFITYDAGGCLLRWEAKTYTATSARRLINLRITAAAVSRCARYVFLGTEEGNIAVVDAELALPEPILAVAPIHEGHNTSIAVFSKHDWVVSSGADETVRLWRLPQTGFTVRAAAERVAETPATADFDGVPVGAARVGESSLVVGCRTGQMLVVASETLTQRLSLCVPGTDGAVSCVAGVPQLEIFLVATASGTLHVFDSLRGGLLSSFVVGLGEPVQALDAHWNGVALVVCVCSSRGEEVSLTVVSDPRAHPAESKLLATCPKTRLLCDVRLELAAAVVRFAHAEVCGGKQLLAIGLLSGQVELRHWSRSDEGRAISVEPVSAVAAHRGAVNDIRFSSSCEVFCSGGVDRYVVVWDSDRLVATWRVRGHLDSITTVHFTESGSIVSTSLDGTVRFWDAADRHREDLLPWLSSRLLFTAPPESPAVAVFVTDSPLRVAVACAGTLRAVEILHQNSTAAVPPSSEGPVVLERHNRPIIGFAALSDSFVTVDDQGTIVVSSATSLRDSCSLPPGTCPYHPAKLHVANSSSYLVVACECGSVAAFRRKGNSAVHDGDWELSSEATVPAGVVAAVGWGGVEAQSIVVGFSSGRIQCRHLPLSAGALPHIDVVPFCEASVSALLALGGRCVAGSATGKIAVVVATAPESSIPGVEPASNATVNVWNAHTKQVTGLAFSGSSCLVSTSSDGWIALWDVEAGWVVRKLPNRHQGPVRCCCSSFLCDIDDSGLLDAVVVTCGNDGTVLLWDELLKREPLKLPGSSHSSANVCGFSGPYVIVGGQDETIRMWNTPSLMSLSASLRLSSSVLRISTASVAHTKFVADVSLSSDQSRLVSGGGDHYACVWDADSRSVAFTIALNCRIRTVQFTHDAACIVTGDDNGGLRAWDSKSGRLLHELACGTAVLQLRVLPKPASLVVATALDHWKLAVWEVDKKRRLWMHQAVSAVHCLAISSSSELLVYGTATGSLQFCHMWTGESLGEIMCHQDGISCVAFSADGERVACVGTDGSLCVCDPVQPAMIRRRRFGQELLSCAFTPDGGHILVSSSTMILLWNGDLREAAQPLESVPAAHCLAVHHRHDVDEAAPTGQLVIVTGCGDASVRWSLVTAAASSEVPRQSVAANQHLSSASPTCSIPLAKLGVAISDFSVAYCSRVQSLRVAAACSDGHIRVWDGTVMDELFSVKVSRDDVPLLAFHMDGDLIAAGTTEKTLFLVSCKTGKAHLVEEGATVLSLAFVSSVPWLVAGLNDHTLCVWSTVTPSNCVRVSRVLLGPVRTLCCSRNGARVAAAADSTLYVYDVATSPEPGSLQLLCMLSCGDGIHAACFANGDTQILCASGIRLVQLWDVDSQKLIRTRNNHTAPVRHLALSSDEQWLFSSSDDRTLRMWPAALLTAPIVLRHDNEATISRIVAWDPSQSDETETDTTTGPGHPHQVFALSSEQENVVHVIPLLAEHFANMTALAESDFCERKLSEENWHVGGVTAIARNHSGRAVVTGGADGSILIWDTRTFEIRQRVRSLAKGPHHTGAVRGIAFFPDDTRLVSVCGASRIILWHTDAPAGMQLISAKEFTFHDSGGCLGVDVSPGCSPDGTHTILSCGEDGVIRVWNSMTLKTEMVLKHGARVTSVAFCSTGPCLVANASCNCRQVERGYPTSDHRHSRWCTAARMALFASGSADQSVKVWKSVPLGELLFSLRGHTAAVRAVRFSPFTCTLISAGEDGVLCLWQVTDDDDDEHKGFPAGYLLRKRQICSAKLKSLSFLRHHVVAAGSDATVITVSANLLDTPLVNPGHDFSVEGVCAAADGSWFASCSEDETIRVWSSRALDTATERGDRSATATVSAARHSHHFHKFSVFSSERRDSPFTCLHLSSDSLHLVTGSDDLLVRLWEFPSGHELFSFQGHTAKIRDVASNAVASIVFSCGDDCLVIVWDGLRGNAIRTVDGHRQAVTCLAVSLLCTKFVTGSQDGSVRLWDTDRQHRVAMGQHSDNVLTVVIGGSNSSSARNPVGDDDSDDDACDRSIATGIAGTRNRWIVSSCADASIVLWDFETLHELRILLAHSGPVHCLALLPGGGDEGVRLCSGGADGALCLWDLTTGALIRHRKNEHSGEVVAIASVASHRAALTVGANGSTRMWDDELALLQPLVLDDCCAPIGPHMVAAAHEQMITVSSSARSALHLLRLPLLEYEQARAKTFVDKNRSDHRLLFAEHRLGLLCACAAMADGHRVATCNLRGDVRIWDVDGNTELFALAHREAGTDGNNAVGSEETVTCIAVCPATNSVACGTSAGHVFLWDVAVERRDLAAASFGGSRSYVRHLHRPSAGGVQEDAVTCITVDRSGTFLATGSSNVVCIWPINDPESVAFTCQGSLVRDGLNTVECVAFSPDGACVASGSSDATIQVWSTGMSVDGSPPNLNSSRGSSGTSRPKLAPLNHLSGGHKDTVRCVCFSPDSTKVVSCGDDSNVCLWDALQSGFQLVQRQCGGSALLACAFSPNGLHIVCAGEGATIFCWNDVLDTSQQTTLRGHRSAVTSVSFLNDSTLSSSSQDGTVGVWRLPADKTCSGAGESGGRDLSEFSPLHGHSGAVVSLSVSGDGRWLVSASEDDTLRLWDLEKRTSRYVKRHWRGAIRCVSFAFSGETFCSGGADRTIYLWDTALGTLTGKIAVKEMKTRSGGAKWKSTDAILSVAYGRDQGKTIAAAVGTAVAVFDTQTKRLRCFGEHDGTVTAVALSPSLQEVCASDGAVIRRWFPWQPNQLGANHQPSLSLTCDAPTAATAVPESSDDLTSRHLQGQALRAHSDTVRALTYSSSGSKLTSCSDDRSVCIWDTRFADRCSLLRRLRGHPEPVRGLGFSGNGKWLVTACEDSNVRLWPYERKAVGKPMQLQGHSAAVLCVCIDEKGTKIASGDATGQVLLWDVENVRAASEQGYAVNKERLRCPAFDGKSVFQIQVPVDARTVGASPSPLSPSSTRVTTT